jgi:hypothetical protein
MVARAGRRTWAITVVIAIAALLLLAWFLTSSSGPGRSVAGEDVSEGRGGDNEVQEELSEQTQERLEAVEEANTEGVRCHVRTNGWAGPGGVWFNRQS